ncbi:MAG: bifunctional phosphoserine phosphatase/homoserine phosphotransferase ThrH [Endomicrobiales bacterium]|nr:bifunctional phosphoserine phosphatase/homoserine phosphotransferase ThrH [Endomicrobiales bacterium]
MQIVCLDLEGVLTPEIWIAVSEKTKISALRATTRDVPDYDVLMKQRIKILKENNLGLKDIQAVIGTLKPLEGALDFLNWLRERFQVAILSDTFDEFALPLMRQLGYPMLLCHRLEIDEKGAVTGYKLRQKDAKRESVRAFKNLNYKVIAVGDSYNDTTMLSEAHAGILFKPPQNVINDFPQFPVTRVYAELQDVLLKAGKNLEKAG